MTNDEKKLASASLIPLEIDPASILSLSKGVIFDTIVHNIQHTLSNRSSEPLPWKLHGMSLICDPSRNKKYLQKLQKMQCVPSVICTEIYHSRLILTDNNTIVTSGKRIVLSTLPRRKLTGIIVARSIDDLLKMEPKTSNTAHFLQYKLLSYEHIPSREIINGPHLRTNNEKILKTVFDFDLTHSFGFPRQLLPVAIVSFTRHEGSDLCSSIQHFLSLEEHQTFDKSYLVTTTNLELIRLRDQQQQRQDEEIENEMLKEKAQSRQPLADLSKKATDTSNARTSPPTQTAPRVPPLKIKLPRAEKPVKPQPLSPTLDAKFQCALKLDRINLSLYNISNLLEMAQEKVNQPNLSSTLANSTQLKTRTLNVNKTYEHNKPLKRLSVSEKKKTSKSQPGNVVKDKRHSHSLSTSSTSTDSSLSWSITSSMLSSISTSTDDVSSPSSSSLPPISYPKKKVEKSTKKPNEKRQPLPEQYRCSLSLSRIDLSLYNLDLPAPPTPATTPMETESSRDSTFVPQQTHSINNPSPTVISDQQTPVERQTSFEAIESTPIVSPGIVPESDPAPVDDNPSILEVVPDDDSLSPIMDEVLTEVMRTTSPSTTNVINNELSSMFGDELFCAPAEAENEKSPAAKDPVDLNEKEMKSNVDESKSPVASSPRYNPDSPDMPILIDDPVVFSIDNVDNSTMENSNLHHQDYMIIVECSDDEEEEEEEENLQNAIKVPVITHSSSKLTESPSNMFERSPPSHSFNALLDRIRHTPDFIDSPRLSTSSSCSSLSMTLIQNQSPRPPLNLIEIEIPQSILNKKQKLQSRAKLSITRFHINIPLIAQEPLIDPRLIYRLQSITTDLHWPTPCNQCSILPHLPTLFTSSTQMISFDTTYAVEFLDPRRDSLKTVILNHLYHRINALNPNLFLNYSGQISQLLLEQTNFRTNCSLHLEYLLHKIKVIDDQNFCHFISANDEFQLSPLLLQMIFN